MKLTMLGTGNALVTKIYNTCFVLEDNNQYFMVDAGGGNQILTQLKKAGYDWKDMKHIFLTHKHIDHLLGMVWMMRMITQFMNAGKYEGDAYIYGHDEVIHILEDMANTLLVPKQSALIGKRLHLVEVKDQETKEIMGHTVTFFDIHSTKAKQFGFMMEYDGKKLTCCGDEPYCEELAKAIVAKCKDAGVVMTGAGATFPYGKDPHDSNIRIAPSFPTLEDLKLAAEIFCVCVKLVSIDKLLAE